MSELLRLCLVGKLPALQRQLRVLRDGLVLGLLGLLLRLKARQSALTAKLLHGHLLPKALLLRGVLGLLRGQCTLKVLLLRLVRRLLGLLSHAERGDLRLPAKLTRLQTLLEGLLLRHVLRRLRCQRLLKVLRDGFVKQPQSLRTHAELRHGGLVGEIAERLLFSESLLAHLRVKADSLRCGLQAQVVFAFGLQLHFGVVRFTARAQALVDKALLQLLPFALQLRFKARHDGVLRRHACIYRHSGKIADVQLSLQFWRGQFAASITKSTFLHVTRNVADAREVKVAGQRGRSGAANGATELLVTRAACDLTELALVKAAK